MTSIEEADEEMKKLRAEMDSTARSSDRRANETAKEMGELSYRMRSVEAKLRQQGEEGARAIVEELATGRAEETALKKMIVSRLDRLEAKMDELLAGAGRKDRNQ